MQQNSNLKSTERALRLPQQTHTSVLPYPDQMGSKCFIRLWGKGTLDLYSLLFLDIFLDFTVDSGATEKSQNLTSSVFVQEQRGLFSDSSGYERRALRLQPSPWKTRHYDHTHTLHQTGHRYSKRRKICVTLDAGSYWIALCYCECCQRDSARTRE